MFDHEFGALKVTATIQPDGRVNTTILVKRPEKIEDVSAMEVAILESFVTKHLVEPAKLLPEVEAFFAIRSKNSGIDGEVGRIELEAEKLDVERRVAVHDLAGEKLLSTLAAIDDKRQAIAQRLAACERGRADFAQEVRDVRKAAESAVVAFYGVAWPTVLELAQRQVDDARQAIASIDATSDLPFRAVLEATDRFQVATNALERLRLLDLTSTFMFAVLNGSRMNLVAASPTRRSAAPVYSGRNVLLDRDAPKPAGHNVTVKRDPGRNVTLK
jgi:hypothetical protein